MKVISFILWVLIGIPLFPIMLIAATMYPAWEKWGETGNFFVLMIWFFLAPIVVPCALIAQKMYPKWEDWGAEF